jgi:hypothetical protein
MVDLPDRNIPQISEIFDSKPSIQHIPKILPFNWSCPLSGAIDPSPSIKVIGEPIVGGGGPQDVAEDRKVPLA